MKTERIVVANRGIPARLILERAAEMGLEPVLLHTPEDAGGDWIQEAARRGFPAFETDSYLNTDRVFEIARETGAILAHPGYGFWAEDFGRIAGLRRRGLEVVGPPDRSLRVWCDKSRSRLNMAMDGIPTPKGVETAVETIEEARAALASVNLQPPYLAKDIMGGSGMGIYLIEQNDQLDRIFRTKKAWGSNKYVFEEYVPNAKHIEVQIFGGGEGQAVHFFSRDCSIQLPNNRKKMVEEAPAPIDDPLEERLTDWAKTFARRCGYQNLGTVEFLLSLDTMGRAKHEGKGNPPRLSLKSGCRIVGIEGNARMQVEFYPSQLISGVNLIQTQIGHALDLVNGNKPRFHFDQSKIQKTGHAVQCRIYAIDPFNNFAPNTGLITHFRPEPMDGVDYQVGIAEGFRLPDYDPMVMNTIAYAPNRDAALDLTQKVLAKLVIEGVADGPAGRPLETNIPYLQWLLDHPVFREGRHHTTFIADTYNEFLASRPLRTVFAHAFDDYMANLDHVSL